MLKLEWSFNKMKIILMLIVIIVLSMFLISAEDPKPVTTVEQLQTENKELKDKLFKLQMLYNYDSSVCNAALVAAREFVSGPQKSKGK